MTETAPSTANRRQPRFNHVAMSMPADALDETGRKEIVEFYREVFGWEELPTLTEDRHRLVLQAYTYEQFVFLIADEPHMTCPGLDHFGMSVGTGTTGAPQLSARWPSRPPLVMTTIRPPWTAASVTDSIVSSVLPDAEMANTNVLSLTKFGGT